MGSVKELITENENNTRKTKNNDLYFKLVCAIVKDDEYMAQNVKSVNGDKVDVEDLKLSNDFRRILATAIKKTTGLSEAEAFEAASKFELNTDQAKTLMNIIHEADYVMMKHCKKKVQLFNKPGFDITLSIGTAPESVRPNPQDRSKSVKIVEHDRLKVAQKIFEFQKKTIKTPSEKKK